MLTGYKSASYKGISFLVQDGSVEFGQKNVIHKFPNSNRTEVEYLGEDAEVFNLTLVIHSKVYLDYVSQRSALKKALTDGQVGSLIHPFEGLINCVVVGKPSLVDNFDTLGICTFTVAFQKYDNAIYPEISTSNFQNIGNLADDLMEKVTDNISSKFSISNAFAYIKSVTKFQSFVDVYNSATGLVAKVEERTGDLYAFALKLEDGVSTIASSATSLADSILGSFNNIDFIAIDFENQLTLLKGFKDYIKDDSLDELTDSYTVNEVRSNDAIITNAVLLCSLALQYKTASVITYTNSDDVDIMEDDLNEQFDNIVENNELDYDSEYTLNELKAEMSKFLEYQKTIVADVETINIKSNTNITNLSYSYYGTTDNADDILDLNNLKTASFISGETKILTDVDS